MRYGLTPAHGESKMADYTIVISVGPSSVYSSLGTYHSESNLYIGEYYAWYEGGLCATHSVGDQRWRFHGDVSVRMTYYVDVTQVVSDFNTVQQNFSRELNVTQDVLHD